MTHNEETYVEQAFMEQLESLNWDTLSLKMTSPPEASYRNSFREVIIESELKACLQQINPWMEEDQLNDVIGRLVHLKPASLIESNKEVTNLLLSNVVVDENRETGAKSPTVKYIDFDNPENNRFLAISQFKVSVPGYNKHIIPDIVLFVNGIPLVVVECKSPILSEPIDEAINQLLRYSNNRPESKEKEGNEQLFHYNQFMIATCRQMAKFSSVGGGYKQYLEWKDPYPFTLHDVNPDGNPNSQQIMVHGMLHPEHLLDIVQNFNVFKENDKGQMLKIVGRYQQYRAVQKAFKRLKNASTPEERSGVIWHTQGSGKSLTMVFLIRKMRNDPELRKYKIVFITDRTDLENQLRDTAKTSGETLYVADKIKQLKDLLKNDSSNIVMGMMQKFQEIKKGKSKDKKQKKKFKPLPVLNRSERILLLVDEAHRTQSSVLAGNVDNALPNCARIAFTGTPLITEKVKKKTTQTFGSYIDKYTIEQSVKDGATLEIIYEGRTSMDAVKDGKALDDVFEDMFKEYTVEEREAIQHKYGTKSDIQEAPKRIEVIAKDIIDHYRKNIMENGFKAQVVVSSRIAAIRYKNALDRTLKHTIENLEQRPPDVQEKEELVTLKRLETATVISADHNDPPDYYPYTDSKEQNRNVKRFKKPLKSDDPDKQDGMAFLVVKDMLITGFDAPVEQVMYLDRKIVEHNLLQAIARVNRPAEGKSCGRIVDYYGIANHLQEALEIFSDEDVKGALVELKDEIPKLKYRYSTVMNVFYNADIDSIDNIDECVDLLSDYAIRAEFIVKFKKFLQSMDTVLPNKAALPYVQDMTTLGFINVAARNRYRDDGLNISGTKDKVRKLIDEYIISQGIDPKVAPISIMADDFESHLATHKSMKSKASEMEHAIRYHINQNIEYDPEFYRNFAEHLEEVLETYKDNWELQVEHMNALREKLKQGRQQEDDGLDVKTHKPFYDILKNEIYGDEEDLSDEEKEKLADLTVDIVSSISNEIQIIDFWKKPPEQKRLKKHISDMLITSHISQAFKKRDKIVTRVMKLAEKKDRILKESSI